jgi:hypothetical protein
MYTVRDASGVTGIAYATFAINDVSHVQTPPEAVNESFSTDASGAALVSGGVITLDPAALLANDSDLDGGTVRFVGLGASNNLVATYVPGVGVQIDTSASTLPVGTGVFTGSFEYEIEDDEGDTATAVASFNFRIPNRNPVAVDDFLEMRTFDPNGIRLPAAEMLGNDTDPDATALSIYSVSLVNPAQGGIVERNGQLLFVPAFGLARGSSVTVNYTVRDNDGAVSQPAQAVFELGQVQAQADLFEYHYFYGGALANGPGSVWVPSSPYGGASGFRVPASALIANDFTDSPLVVIDAELTGPGTLTLERNAAGEVTFVNVVMADGSNVNGAATVRYTVRNAEGWMAVGEATMRVSEGTNPSLGAPQPAFGSAWDPGATVAGGVASPTAGGPETGLQGDRQIRMELSALRALDGVNAAELHSRDEPWDGLVGHDAVVRFALSEQSTADAALVLAIGDGQAEDVVAAVERSGALWASAPDAAVEPMTVVAAHQAMHGQAGAAERTGHVEQAGDALGARSLDAVAAQSSEALGAQSPDAFAAQMAARFAHWMAVPADAAASQSGLDSVADSVLPAWVNQALSAPLPHQPHLPHALESDPWWDPNRLHAQMEGTVRT